VLGVEAIGVLDIASNERNTFSSGQNLEGDISGFFALTFSKDGSRLASGSHRKGLVKIWDTSTWKSVSSYLGPDTSRLDALAISPDGKWCTSAWEPSEVMEALNRGKSPESNCGLVFKVWDANTGDERFSLNGGKGYEVNSVTFSPDGTVLAASIDRKPKMWDMATGIPRGIETRMGENLQLSTEGDIGDHFQFSPRGTYLVNNGADGVDEGSRRGATSLN
jgi:hypothetical protein